MWPKTQVLAVRRFTLILIAGFVLVATRSFGAEGPARGISPPPAHETAAILHLEIKLYVRSAGLLRRAAIDQWAGARLLMQSRKDGSVSVHSLTHPLQDPWTLRWYAALDEVKLGAAVNVVEPHGDPYGSLAGPLTTIANTKYAEWWDGDDLVAPTVNGSPDWIAEAQRFWQQLHRREESAKDELPEHPVYPFHVLGDPLGRFEFRVDASGRVPRNTISDRMSEPWLSNGWNDWLRGDRRPGYGFWESRQPNWEPRTYPAVAAALGLLDWSPLPALDPEGGLPADGTHYEISLDPAHAFDLPSMLAHVVATLNPQFEHALDWHGALKMTFDSRRTAGAQVVVGESGEVRLPKEEAITLRVWRYARLDTDRDCWVADELQALVTDDRDRMKLWIRVGYLPASIP